MLRRAALRACFDAPPHMHSSRASRDARAKPTHKGAHGSVAESPNSPSSRVCAERLIVARLRGRNALRVQQGKRGGGTQAEV
eukprot:6174049-Pleurochrysis_carterae.AAC.4